MIRIDENLIAPLRSAACSSQRKRKNHNFHLQAGDRIHRMIHAMEPGTYVQPHKHENPDKLEAFIVLEGKVAVIEYNDQGEITDWIMLNPATGNHGLEIPPRTWHSLICMESGTVIYEVKDGPWDQADDKCFAPWAPTEGDEECNGYIRKILEKILSE